VADLSFISLTLVLPALAACAGPDADFVLLVKPQFEAGRAHVKKGIIRDAQIHAAVCEDLTHAVAALGWSVLGIIASPILGRDGNREFLLGAKHD